MQSAFSKIVDKIKAQKDSDAASVAAVQGVIEATIDPVAKHLRGIGGDAAGNAFEIERDKGPWLVISYGRFDKARRFLVIEAKKSPPNALEKAFAGKDGAGGDMLYTCKTVRYRLIPETTMEVPVTHKKMKTRDAQRVQDWLAEKALGLAPERIDDIHQALQAQPSAAPANGAMDSDATVKIPVIKPQGKKS